MRDEVIHARIQSDIKEQSEQILDLIGLTMSQAINLFLKQLVMKKRIPFNLDTEEKEINEIENKKINSYYNYINFLEKLWLKVDL